MNFTCCDCAEYFDTQSLLEQHISIEHLSWSPYWCLYCKQNGVTLKKATKDALKVHVEKIHVGEQFLFIYEPDDAKEEEHRSKLNRSLALAAHDDTTHYPLLSPAPTPVSPTTSSALEPKLEPLEEEFQLPANSSDTGCCSWQFSSPLSHCLTCDAQILNDGHQHKCQLLEKPADPPDNKQEVLSYQSVELFPPEHNLINNEPTPTLMSKGKNTFQCTVCGKEYGTSLSLRMHEDAKMHWGLLKHKTRLKCDFCPAKYHFAKGMQLHWKRLHNAEPNTAQDDTAHHSLLSPDPSQASTSSALEPKLKPTPTLMCKAKKKFQCTVCGKEYSSPLSLRMHEDAKMHWGSLKHLTRLNCDLCPAKYHFAKAMRLHKKWLHNAEPNAAQDDTTHHAQLYPVTPSSPPVSPSTSSAPEPKLEPLEESDFQLPANSSDMGWQFSSPLSHCLTCGTQILNDGPKHNCQFPSTDNPVMDPSKQEVPFITPTSKAKKKKKKFQCSVCGKECSTPLYLKKHEDCMMHWGLLKHLTCFKCDLCPAKYHFANAMRLHKKRLHNAEPNAAQDDTAHHSLLSPAPAPVSPSSSALEPKLEPFEDSEFQLPANSSDMGHFSFPLSNCLPCGQQISNDGHEHKCQLVDKPVDSSDNKHEVLSYQLGEFLAPEHSLINNEPTPTLTSKAKNTFQCTVCGKEYSAPLSLRVHEDDQMHWGLLKHLTRLNCDLCPAKYHFAKSLRLHRKWLHNAEPNTAQDDAAHHSHLSPAPTPVSPSTSSAPESKFEPLEESEFQLPANSNDMGWQFSSPLSHCLTCGTQILNDGHKHKCLFPILTSEAKKKLQCTVCGKEFSTSLSLKKHEDRVMHWGLLKHLTRLKCDLCPAKYHFVKALQLHRKELHNAEPNIYSCWCRKKYTHKSQLLFHQDHRQHHPKSAQKGLQKCPMCSSVFHFKAILKGHLRSHQPKANTRKIKEPKSTSSNSRNARFRIHHRPFMTKCKLCSRRIPNNRASKRRHANLHFSGKPIFKCSMCPKEFEKLNALRSHEDQKMHWGTLKHLAEYHCETCNCTFHYRNSRRMHKEMIDDDNGEKNAQPAPSTQLKAAASYRCELCEQEFDDLETLNLHRETENHLETEEPVVCPSCNKSFRNKRSFVVHKTKVHSGKKANLKFGTIFDCAGCGKVCNNLTLFSLHARHRCPNLKQGIAQAQSVVYSCSMCPRKFNSIVTMRLHQRAHRNETDSTKVMSTCVPCSKSLAPREIDSHLLRVHITKVNDQVTLIQGDGNVLDERSLFGGDVMSKMREKLIVRDQMEKPKLKLEARKCKHCGKLFTTKEKLKKHQEMLVKSKLLSAKVDFIQGEKHLMAKLCVKKCVKVIRKCSNVHTKV